MAACCLGTAHGLGGIGCLFVLYRAPAILDAIIHSHIGAPGGAAPAGQCLPPGGQGTRSDRNQREDERDHQHRDGPGQDIHGDADAQEIGETVSAGAVDHHVGLVASGIHHRVPSGRSYGSQGEDPVPGAALLPGDHGDQGFRVVEIVKQT
jgi:hypothetical protein